MVKRRDIELACSRGRWGESSMLIQQYNATHKKQIVDRFYLWRRRWKNGSRKTIHVVPGDPQMHRVRDGNWEVAGPTGNIVISRGVLTRAWAGEPVTVWGDFMVRRRGAFFEFGWVGILGSALGFDR